MTKLTDARKPYTWLPQENYIELVSPTWRAQLSPKGKALLDSIKETL